MKIILGELECEADELECLVCEKLYAGELDGGLETYGALCCDCKMELDVLETILDILR